MLLEITNSFINRDLTPAGTGTLFGLMSLCLVSSEAKTPQVDAKNGKRAEAAGGGGDAKYSMFTWFVVLALLGVWSSVAVVYFDIVDYDSVIGK